MLALVLSLSLSLSRHLPSAFPPFPTNLAVGDGGGRLLLAEALHALRRRHDCLIVWVAGEGAGEVNELRDVLRWSSSPVDFCRREGLCPRKTLCHFEWVSHQKLAGVGRLWRT